MRLTLHRHSQDAIDASLVASAVAFQPVQHVRIEANGQLLFGRRPCSRRLFEKGLVEWRNVRIVDLGIPHAINPRQIALDRSFAHVGAPFSWDNACPVVAWGMGDHNQATCQQAQRDQPLLPIIETVIFECDARPVKDVFRVLEAQAMLREVLPAFLLDPFVIPSITATLFVVSKPAQERTDGIRSGGCRTRPVGLAAPEVRGKARVQDGRYGVFGLSLEGSASPIRFRTG